MKYPSCILNGKGAKGDCISIAVASKNQVQDAGAKMIHLAPNTKSNIVSKSIAEKGGIANYRGETKISKNAINSKASIKCDTILLDDISHSDTFPTNIVGNNSSILEHEATISKVSAEKLFYLEYSCSILPQHVVFRWSKSRFLYRISLVLKEEKTSFQKALENATKHKHISSD